LPKNYARDVCWRKDQTFRIHSLVGKYKFVKPKNTLGKRIIPVMLSVNGAVLESERELERRTDNR
jgi:hypothetical protein